MPYRAARARACQREPVRTTRCLIAAHILAGDAGGDLLELYCGNGNFTLTLPNKPAMDGKIKANFEAKPRYAKEEGAIYFDNFELKEYSIEPASMKQQFAPLMGYLVSSLKQRLSKEPAYRLNEKDKDQAWLKAHVTGFEMTPGKLRLITAEKVE